LVAMNLIMSKFVRMVTIIVLMLTAASFLPLAKAEDLITAPLDELLPSRDDIPSEWWTGGSWNVTLSESGFVEGKAVGYYKEFGEYSEMDVDFCVYRFSNVSSAEAYCDKEINQIKSGGGYTEISILGAFAVVYDYGTEEEGMSWGVINNIVYKVEVYNDYILEDPTDELVSFTNLEMDIIPEFPSFLILPLFMTATLIAVIVYRRHLKKRNASVSIRNF